MDISHPKIKQIVIISQLNEGFRVDTLIDQQGKDFYCGWSSMRIFNHISTHILLIPISVFAWIWIFKDSGYWIISGIIV